MNCITLNNKHQTTWDLKNKLKNKSKKQQPPYSFLHCILKKVQINTIPPTHKYKQRYFRDVKLSSLTICFSAL